MAKTPPSLFPGAPTVPDDIGKKDKKGGQVDIVLSQSVTALGSRLRVLEERYTNLRRKTQVTDQNMLELEKDLRDEIKSMHEALKQIQRDMDEVSKRSLQMKDEMLNTIKESDFKVLKKYVEFWEPLNFITREEAKNLINGGKPPKKQLGDSEKEVVEEEFV